MPRHPAGLSAAGTSRFASAAAPNSRSGSRELPEPPVEPGRSRSARGRGCLDTTPFRGRPSERLLARCFPAPARFAAGEPSQPGQAEGVWPLSRLPRLWNLQPRAAPPPCRDTLPVSRLQGPRALPPLRHPTLAQGAGSRELPEPPVEPGRSRFSPRQGVSGGVWIPLPSVDGPLSASSRAMFSRAGRIATRRPSTQVNHCLWSLMRARGQFSLTAVQPL